MTTALPRIVDFLRAAHRADAAQFASYANAVDALPRVMPSEAGAVAVSAAGAAKTFVKQLPHAHVSALPALRLCILSASDVLQQELNAHHQPPYYNRG